LTIQNPTWSSPARFWQTGSAALVAPRLDLSKSANRRPGFFNMANPGLQDGDYRESVRSDILGLKMENSNQLVAVLFNKSKPKALIHIHGALIRFEHSQS
jgi:hypothetical protein